MSKSERPALPFNRNQAALALGIFLLALLIRLAGIGWGLPNELHNQSYHPDEQILVAWSHDSGNFAPTQLKLVPGHYNYGTFYLTSLNLAAKIVTFYGGTPEPKGDAESLRKYLAMYHLAGRLLNAFACAGMALAIFLIVSRLIGRFGAVFAGLAIALAPGLVVHSRFQTVDVFATFLLAMSTFFALRILPIGGEERSDKQVLKDVLLAGLFAGLSAGTKYTGLLVLLTLYVVLVLVRRKDALKLSALATLVAVGVFLATTPGFVTDHEQFMRDFTFEMGHTASGHGLVFVGTASAFIYHLTNLWVGLGGLLVLVALAGLGWATYRRWPWALALLAFFVPYYILIGRAEVKFLRYTFPLYVALAVGFGYAAEVGKKKGRWGHAVVGVAILGLGGFDTGGLRKTATITAGMMGAEPRDQAARFLKDLGTASPNISVGLVTDPWYYTPPLIPDSANTRDRVPQIAEELLETRAPKVIRYMPDGLAARVDWDVRLVTTVRPEYIVYSNIEEADVRKLVGRTDIPEDAQVVGKRYKEFQDALAKNYTLLQPQFGTEGDQVQDMMYVEPVIYIWKRKDLP